MWAKISDPNILVSFFVVAIYFLYLRRVVNTLLLWFPFISTITTFEIFINFLLNNPNNQIETVLSVGDIFLILTLPQVG